MIMRTLNIINRGRKARLHYSSDKINACSIRLTSGLLRLPILLIKIRLMNTRTNCSITSTTILIPINSRKMRIIPYVMRRKRRNISSTLTRPYLYLLIRNIMNIPSMTTMTQNIDVLTRHNNARTCP